MRTLLPSPLPRRRVLAGGAALLCGGAAGPKLDVGRLEPSFATNFADASKPVFRVDGGPFSTRFERFSGARTLAPNREMQLYVDPAFVPSPGGTDAGGRNDAPAPGGVPAGLNPFRVEGGALVITASRTPAALLDAVGRPYVSGLLSTDRSFDQRYGYFEMRAQLPAGRGLWPAFWLFGTTEAYRLEIDVLEVLGADTRRIYHSAQPNTQRGEGTHLPLRPGFDTAAGMHDYGVLWTPEALTFHVDRRPTATIDGAPFRGEVSVYMMANLAVGGTWGGPPDDATRFPAEMRIEHIKAYRLA